MFALIFSYDISYGARIFYRFNFSRWLTLGNVIPSFEVGGRYKTFIVMPLVEEQARAVPGPELSPTPSTALYKVSGY